MTHYIKLDKNWQPRHDKDEYWIKNRFKNCAMHGAICKVKMKDYTVRVSFLNPEDPLLINPGEPKISSAVYKYPMSSLVWLISLCHVATSEQIVWFQHLDKPKQSCNMSYVSCVKMFLLSWISWYLKFDICLVTDLTHLQNMVRLCFLRGSQMQSGVTSVI